MIFYDDYHDNPPPSRHDGWTMQKQEQIELAPEEKIREDFEEWWVTAKLTAPLHTHSMYFARIGYQAGRESKQKEIDDLVAAMKEVLRISDRKHDAWDKVYALIEKGELDENS